MIRSVNLIGTLFQTAVTLLCEYSKSDLGSTPFKGAMNN